MNKLGRILFDRMVILRVEFLPEGGSRTTAHLWQHGDVMPAQENDLRRCPVILLVCGQGVVTKPADTEIVARIRKDGQTFLWSESHGRVSFVRRSQVEPQLKELAEREVIPVWIGCIEAGEELGTAADEAAQVYFSRLRWRDLFHPTAESSAAAQVLVRRTALPVLGTLLLLLLANTFASSSLAARRNELDNTLALRTRTEERTGAADERRRQLLQDFAAHPALPYSVLCDRVAAAVPEQVTLTSLEVEPPTKRFEPGKPLLRREGMATVRGTATDPAAIGQFTDRLAAAGFANAHIVAVEKEREGNRLVFRLELKL